MVLYGENLMSQSVKNFLDNVDSYVIQQVKEWAEIIVDFETSNKYEVLDDSGNKKGFVAEKGSGFMKMLSRQFFRSHRPLEVDIFDGSKQAIMLLQRKFFWFFSDLFVTDGEGNALGSVHRKFGILYKKYDLMDKAGNQIATIKSPLWRLWTFPVLDKSEKQIGVITKKWGGILKEAFTDADKYRVEFPSSWSYENKAVLLAASISIDFDFFEDNQRNN
jgi:uncharacterized protein YxjI